MFAFLSQELETIKTRRFHIVDGPADASLKAVIEACDVPFPRSYKDFVVRFGNAKLYRQAGGYIVGVLCSPVEGKSDDGDTFYVLGHYQSSRAYFKATLLAEGEETPVFEGRGKEVANGFEEWLTKRCQAARATFNRRRWANVVAGPSPFTAAEQRIARGRKLFSFRVAGVTPQDNILVEVHNGSDITLPFLSIGVRWKDSSLEGGVWLPVSHIAPGMTAIVEHDVYRKMVATSGVEVFELPDPEPEDRERYWEFK
jgi:hypothetical protein